MSGFFRMDKVFHIRNRIANVRKLGVVLGDCLLDTVLLDILQQKAFFVDEAGAHSFIGLSRAILAGFLTVFHHVVRVGDAFAIGRPEHTVFVGVLAVVADHLAVGSNFAAVF